MNRRKLIMAAIFLLSAALTGCAGKQSKGPEISFDDHEIRIYEVFGMDCPGCHGGLENLVLKIPSVLAARADWKEQRLEVAVKPGSSLDDERVFDAIRRANFTAGKRIQ